MSPQTGLGADLWGCAKVQAAFVNIAEIQTIHGGKPGGLLDKPRNVQQNDDKHTCALSPS